MVTDFKGNTYKTIKEMCEHYNISYDTYRKRIAKGWSQEKTLCTPRQHVKCHVTYKGDLTGQTFGFLYVIGKDDRQNQSTRQYKCRCKCGNIVYLIPSVLLRGSVKSCGCLRLNMDLLSQKNQDYITYNKSHNSYCVSIQRKKKNYFFGYFKTYKEAKIMSAIVKSFVDKDNLLNFRENRKEIFTIIIDSCKDANIDPQEIVDSIYDNYLSYLYLDSDKLKEFIKDFSLAFIEE